jgi:hypothetical protein
MVELESGWPTHSLHKGQLLLAVACKSAPVAQAFFVVDCLLRLRGTTSKLQRTALGSRLNKNNGVPCADCALGCVVFSLFADGYCSMSHLD